MIIEQKQISPNQILLFFPTPLSIIGTISNQDNMDHFLCSPLKASKSYLLTKDFLYIEADTPNSLEDLILSSIIALDDYTTSPTQITAPATNQEAKIIKILKLIVSPFLNKDGGDVEFSHIINNTVYVKFLGKCNGCPYAQKTLTERVEKNLISYLPIIRKAELI